MSLSRLLTRVAAVHAIRNATLAQERVFDSAILPINQVASEENKPVVIVLTDDDTTEIKGRDLYDGERNLDLVIEVAAAAAVAVTAEGVTVSIPHTDAGLEIVLDLMEHQVERALVGALTPWSVAFMDLVPRIVRRISRRGASADKGVRFAARQIVYTCDTVSTPVAGQAIEAKTPFASVLALMDGDPELGELADLVKAAVESTAAPDWRRAATALGLTEAEARSIALGLFDPAATNGGVPPTVTVVNAVDEGGVIVVNEEDAAYHAGENPDA